ncbi:hypothetical protein WJX81_001783 [Elliptochloris bilobata]|uniref:Methyltransferase type 11 domain-containing protein n=1 Tax=Elliptochloris bilobata TaxID=381761 RepID=A0AAW1S678_9CHLO
MAWLTRWPMRRWFRVLWCILAAACLGGLPWIITEFTRADFSIHYQAWFVAGIFVLLALPVSIYEVAMQLEYFSRPTLQIRVIRILWMVPIYALDSWFALRFKGTALYLDVIRECYEAYVIYNFFMYLVAYLEDEYGDVDAYFSTKEDVPHLWGLNYLVRPWRMGEEFFWECKKGVLSYVILRPVMTAAGFIGQLCGMYGDGQLRFDRVYLYTVLVSNFSQFWALYCLVLFYKATAAELAPIRPVSKFLCVKAVVFLTYWQGVTISILVWMGVIKTKDWTTYDVDDVAAGLQEFLICVEMFFAALAHAQAFPPRDYLDPSGPPPRGVMRNLRIMFDVTDVVDDVHGVVDDTVTTANKKISRAGEVAWKQTKRLRQPSRLLAVFGGRRRESAGADSEYLSDDGLEEGAVDRRPLLSCSDRPQEEHGVRAPARLAAAAYPVQETASATEQAVEYLKAAASGKRLPPAQVLSAILALEKAKLPADDYLDVLGGRGKQGGKRWRLIFNAGKEQVNDAAKGGKGGGLYFPLTAVQRWDSNAMVIENGVYLGWPAALTFRGPFVMSGRKLTFTFDKLRIRLGPKWVDFPLQAGQLGTTADTEDKKSPFFLFLYADDEKLLDTPSRAYNPDAPNVGDEYDSWTQEGILEYYWGEHIHLGYYSAAERAAGYKRKDFKRAKIDFVDEMLRWSGAQEPARILDVGCGIGGTSRHLAAKFLQAHVQGITLSPKQVERAGQLAAERGLANVDFRVMNALAMEYPDDSFDLVWACESGEHMPDKKAYVDEMVRVLKPGGTLVIATWCQREAPPERPFTARDCAALQFLYDEWAHPFFVSVQEYSRLLEATGKVEAVAIDDWTDVTLPTWRHSNWVGVWDPWPVILKLNPLIWYRVEEQLPEA